MPEVACAAAAAEFGNEYGSGGQQNGHGYGCEYDDASNDNRVR